jgi:ATP-dependent Clp protease adaptor protein ClpS
MIARVVAQDKGLAVFHLKTNRIMDRLRSVLSMGSSPTAEPMTAPPQTRMLPPYHVILLDDDDHTYDYVIEMLTRLFHIDRQRAYGMACEVDSAGRVVVFTGPLEQAELKQDQIHSYGRDWRLERSVGSMSAIIEPCE